LWLSISEGITVRQIDARRARGRLAFTLLPHPREAVALDEKRRIFNRGAPVADDQTGAFEERRAAASTLEGRPDCTGQTDDRANRQDSRQ
jgi:hypothetical protein